MDRLVSASTALRAPHRGRLPALLFASALALASCAAPQPLVVEITPVSTRKVSTKAAEVSGCAVVVLETRDRRRVPDTLGVVAGRAVKSPDDVGAWLRSIFEGLRTRGVEVSFGDGAAPVGAIALDISLQSAWLSDIKTSKAANVVVHARAERAGEKLLDRDYRGTITRVNWASTDSELRSLVDDAFGQILDQMAAELRGICAS